MGPTCESTRHGMPYIHWINVSILESWAFLSVSPNIREIALLKPLSW